MYPETCCDPSARIKRIPHGLAQPRPSAPTVVFPAGNLRPWCRPRCRATFFRQRSSTSLLNVRPRRPAAYGSRSDEVFPSQLVSPPSAPTAMVRASLRGSSGSISISDSNPSAAAAAATGAAAPSAPLVFTELTPVERAQQLLQEELGLSAADLPPPSLHVEIAIAGGGLGGLALAVGLQQNALQQQHAFSTPLNAHVFEAASALRTDSGTTFGASAHCFAALDGVQQGLGDAVKALGCSVAMVKAFRKDLGSECCAPATVIQRPGTSKGLTVVPWHAAQRVLATRVRPESVHCSHQLITYLPAPEGSGVDVVFLKRDKDAHKDSLSSPPHHSEEQRVAEQGKEVSVASIPREKHDGAPANEGEKLTRMDGKGHGAGTVQQDNGKLAGEQVEVVVVRAQMLVGADGIRSAVRRTMVGDNSRYLRCINWNALVPNLQPWPTGPAAEPNTIIFGDDRQARLTWFHSDAGNGQTFWQLRIFDTELTATATLDPKFGGFGRPGAKERALSLLNQRLDEAGRRNPSAAGAANAKPTTADCSEGAAPETSDSAGGVPERWSILQRVIQSTDEKLIFERLLHDRLPLDSWSDLGGRVVLLGDAAHPMFPGPGQGAQMAFEDAHQLCESVRAHFSAAIGRAEEGIGAGSAAHDDAAADVGVLPTTAVVAVTSLYEKMRVQRCTRVQSFAAEASALPAEEVKTEAVRALTQEEIFKRLQEFIAWLDKYPDCPTGDPDSSYWRPST